MNLDKLKGIFDKKEINTETKEELLDLQNEDVVNNKIIDDSVKSELLLLKNTKGSYLKS